MPKDPGAPTAGACVHVGDYDVKALGWLDHVSVGRKIAAIVGALLIPIAFLTYLLISEKQISISFAEAELDGVAFLRPVDAMMRGAVRTARGGAGDWTRWEAGARRGAAAVWCCDGDGRAARRRENGGTGRARRRARVPRTTPPRASSSRSCAR